MLYNKTMILGANKKSDIVTQLAMIYGYSCFLCGGQFTTKDKPTLDHFIPTSRGGSGHIDNLRLMHRDCNTLKSDRLMYEDGTLEPIEQSPRRIKRRKLNKNILDKFCERCLGGRMLRQAERCISCLSSPGPATGVWWRKSDTKSCNHLDTWCMSCSSGLIERIIPISCLI